MRTSEVVDLIRKEFYHRLERKTGWGKEEVKKELESAINQVISNLLDELIERVEATK